MEPKVDAKKPAWHAKCVEADRAAEKECLKRSKNGIDAVACAVKANKAYRDCAAGEYMESLNPARNLASITKRK